MGAGASLPKDEEQFVSTRKRNLSASNGIEQQIPVEFKPRKKLGKHRSQNNQTTSFQSLSNSFTNYGHGPSSILKKKSTGASLRSVLSNDTVLDTEMSVEMEKLRREFENFKLSKQNEIADMQKREKKLESENKRLRGEVQALQKTCTRLRNERESALENESQALERARAFEDDRNNILNQLRVLQESEAQQNNQITSPVANLGCARHDSEHGASDTSSNSPQRGAETSSLANRNVNSRDLSFGMMTNSNIAVTHRPQNSAHIESFKFEASVKPSVAVPPAFVHWPGASEHIWSSLDFVVGYFEPQLEDDVDLFMDVWYSKYEESLYECHGLKMTCTSRLLMPENIQSFSSSANILIIFLESKITESDLKSLQNLLNELKSSSILNVLFCFKQADVSTINGNMSRFKKLLAKLNSNESPSCLFIENYHQIEPLVSLVNESVDQFVVKHYSEGVLGACDCHRDFQGLLYQKDAFASHLDHLPSLQMASIDQYVFCINRHILKEGPAPPLVIKSSPGFGKSTVLAHFLKKHKLSNPTSKVLYHFVDTCEFSKDSSMMMKRFAYALNSLMNPVTTEGGQISSNFESFSSILEFFPRRNMKRPENFSSSFGSPQLLIIAIDSADKFKDAEKILEWILDPLPVDVRVILSVDSETCPASWTSLPSIQIKPQLNVFTSSLSESQKKKMSDLKLTSPLFSKLLSKVDISHIPPLAADLENGKDVLLRGLISTVAHHSSVVVDTVYKVLYFVARSYQGLSSFWLLRLWKSYHPSSTTQDLKVLKKLLYKLGSSKLLTFRRSNYVLTSSCLHSFVVQRMTRKDKTLVKNISNRFLEVLSNSVPWKRHIPFDVVLESVSILNSDEVLNDRLKGFLSQASVFIHLYQYDYSSLLIAIFSKLGVDTENLTDEFSSELNELERKPEDLETLLQTLESLAAFNSQLGLFSKAAHLYGKCLELRELNLDPDHPSCSRTLYLNALLHLKWEKVEVAETLLKQSIDILETATEETSEASHLNYVQLVQNFELLGVIYQRLGKVKQFEANAKKLTYLRSMAFIQDFLGSVSSEPLSALTLSDSSTDSLEKANHLNEYAVLMFYQGNCGEAEESFKVSLNIRQKLLGPNHIECSQSLFNMGGFYFERKEYSKCVTFFEKAVAIRKELSGSNVSLLMSTYQWLIIAYRKSGSRQRAMELLKDLLKLNIETYGEDHQFVASNYANMASVYCEMKKFEDAMPLFESALHIFTSTLGPYHDKVIDTLNNMALLKFEMDDFEAAVNLYRQAQECKQIGLGMRETSTSHLPLTPTHGRHRRLGSDFQSQQSLNSIVE